MRLFLIKIIWSKSKPNKTYIVFVCKLLSVRLALLKTEVVEQRINSEV